MTRLHSDSAWDLQAVTPPWADVPSIYAHILEHASDEGLTEGGERLPDEVLVRAEGGIPWAAGALDGVMGHHFGGSQNPSVALTILQALRALTAEASEANARNLYGLIVTNQVLSYIDELLLAIGRDRKLDHQRLYEVAMWLAKRAPDREAVKFALALLGGYSGPEVEDALQLLGRHEEFTLYTAVALTNSIKEQARAEQMLWRLAKQVRGWGRIEIVSRLAGTANPDIKAWMLREGYKNSIMDEYLAYTCATSGGLLAELERPSPDAALLASAGRLLATLIHGQGGPAEGMADYADGAAATEQYLRHLQRREVSLEQFTQVADIQAFVDRPKDSDEPSVTSGWAIEQRALISELCGNIMSRPGWAERTLTALAGQDGTQFYIATRAAAALGIDAWPAHFRRLLNGELHEWWHVMQTDDPERVDKVLAEARARLALDEIASGPAEELGLGLDFAHHSALDFILQDLGRFPGKGWDLMQVGLRSPVIRNRHMVLNTLEAWGEEHWPPGAKGVLEQALSIEPHEKVRVRLEELIAGERPE